MTPKKSYLPSASVETTASTFPFFVNSIFTLSGPLSEPLLTTDPVIPNPMNSKLISLPWEHRSVWPSISISNSAGSTFQPLGGIAFSKNEPLSSGDRGRKKYPLFGAQSVVSTFLKMKKNYVKSIIRIPWHWYIIP